jgi:hypothetical protein
MPVEAFLAHAARFAQLRPPELTVTNVAGQWYDLFTHPHLPAATRMQMYTPRPWGGSPPWSLTADVVGRLGELGRGNRIRGLDLSRCRAGDGAAIQLAEHAEVWHLEDLDLAHNDVEYTGLMALLLSPIPEKLRRVNLCGNPLNDRCAQVLAERWPSTDSLKWLRVEGTNIGPRGRQVLLDRFGPKAEVDTPPPP